MGFSIGVMLNLFEIYQDPLKLKEAILHHSANYQENPYEIAIIYDAWKNLLNAN